MIVTYIRSSSYNGYDYCQMQYFLTYVLGHRSDSGKKADLGTMVHKVMEVLAGLKKFQQDNPRKKYLTVDDDAVGKVKFDKNILLSEGIVEDLVDLSFNSYKKGSKHKWTPADRKEVSRLSWLALNWNEGQFDPRYRNIVDPEPHFDIPIEEDWAKYEYEMPNGEVIQGRLAIKGTIDLVTKVDDDTIEVTEEDEDVEESSSAAQQAAIAIAMKKAGKKPKKEMNEWVESVVTKNYHGEVTTKEEIYEMIGSLSDSADRLVAAQSMFNVDEQQPSPSKPDTDTPVREKPTTKPDKPKRENPFEPRRSPRPKAELPKELTFKSLGLDFKQAAE